MPQPWLRWLMDGLVLLDGALVADPGLGRLALDFAAGDPDRVGRVLLLEAVAREVGRFLAREAR